MIDTSILFQRNYTNCLRGISVLIIFFLHIIFKWEDMPRFLTLPASLFVSVFILLSGYGIHESYKKYGLKGYWHKRFKRIILPYTLLITVSIPFTNNFNWKDYLLDITYIHSSCWFIEFIIYNYLVYWLAQRFFPQSVFLILLLFGFVGLNSLMPLEGEQSFSFVAGVLFSCYIDKIRSLSVEKLVTYAFFGFVFGTLFVLLKEIPYVHSYKGTIAYNYILVLIKLPMSLCILLLPLFVPVLLRSKVLYWAGIGSLEIYLVHSAMMDYVEIDFLRILLYTIFTIVFSFIFYRVNQLIIRII